MKVFAKIVISILMFAIAASAATYTHDTVKGNYSVLLENGGAALVGLLKFDGASDVTMSYTQTGPSSGTLSGTYTVDSNGTGTITMSGNNQTITLSFVLGSVVEGNAKILNMVVTDGGGGGGTATHQ
jgi:hypothetical protein